MKEKIRKILKSNGFFYTALVLSMAAVFLGYFKIEFFVDERLNKLIIDLLPRFFATFFLLSAAVYLDCSLKKGEFLKGLFWAIPCFFVALANFPFSALISKTATVERVDLVWLLVLRCLLVASTEELFFRGILIKLLEERVKGKMKVLKTVFLSSAFFGAWHLTNLFQGAGIGATLLQVLYTFLIGLMLAVTYIKTKNIFIPILIHGLFNVGGSLILDLGSGNPQDTIFWILTVLIGVLAGVYVLINYLKLEKEGLKSKEEQNG